MPLPVDGDWTVTALFGPTNEPLDSGGFNKGIDIGVPVGTPIKAVAGGTVIQAGDRGDGWGTSVKIQDANGFIHNYGHLSSAGLQVGQQVAPGTVVGKSGNTGASTGPHLSYDVLNSSWQAVDPSPWLGFNAAGDNRQFSWKPLSQMTAVQQGGGGGSVTGQQGAPGGQQMATTYYRDPATDSQYKTIRDAANEAMQEWIDNGRPSGDDSYFAMVDAMDALHNFQAVHADDRIEYKDPADDAQQQFDNSIRLGDFHLREADQAFRHWFDKQGLARKDTENELAQRENEMARYDASMEARTTSPGAASMRPEVMRGYLPGQYEGVLDKWQGRAGVGSAFEPEPPSAMPSPVVAWDQTTPPEQTATPGGPTSSIWDAGGRAPEPTAPSPSDQFVPGNPWSQPDDVPRGGAMNPPGYPQPKAQPQPSWKDRALDWGMNMAGGGMTPLGPAGVMGGTVLSAWENRDKAKSGASKVGNTAKKWWQRAFAEGGTNIPGGPGWVGERGPEIMEVPGFGRKIVGQNGPEEVMIPQGANIIPAEEAFAMHQIRKAAQQGPMQPGSSPQEQAARANDPQLQQKVMESLRKAMALGMATNPPPTPIPRDGAPDFYAPLRPLSGVYPPEQLAAMEGKQPK